MRTLLIASALLTLPAAVQAQSPTAEELTRMLNGAPPAARPAPQSQSQSQAQAQSQSQSQSQSQAQPRPVAPRSAPAPTPVVSPRAATAPNTGARPVQPPASATVAPRSAPVQTQPSVRAPNAATPNATTPNATTPNATTPNATTPNAATPTAPARTTPSAPSRAPASTQAPTPVPAPASGPAALSPAAVAALPFRIDLPSGFQLFESRAAADARVWSVRRAGKTFAMIYAGPSSQFPIYDGEQVTAAGRVTVVVPDGTRRIAMEHLFQRAAAPTEIHVWLMSLDGADRDAAERIAQSVDPR